MTESNQGFKPIKMKDYDQDLLLIICAPMLVIFPVNEGDAILPLFTSFLWSNVNLILMIVSIFTLYFSNKYTNKYLRNFLFGIIYVAIYWNSFIYLELSLNYTNGIVSLASGSILHLGIVYLAYKAIAKS